LPKAGQSGIKTLRFFKKTKFFCALAPTVQRSALLQKNVVFLITLQVLRRRFFFKKEGKKKAFKNRRFLIKRCCLRLSLRDRLFFSALSSKKRTPLLRCTDPVGSAAQRYASSKKQVLCALLQKNFVFLGSCTYGAAQHFASKKRRFFVRFAQTYGFEKVFF
jgi:hypothetical protein